MPMTLTDAIYENCDLLEGVRIFHALERKIDGIKFIRSKVHHMGLKEAKDAFEAFRPEDGREWYSRIISDKDKRRVAYLEGVIRDLRYALDRRGWIELLPPDLRAHANPVAH